MKKRKGLALCLFIVCVTTTFMHSCTNNNDDDGGKRTEVNKRVVAFGPNANNKWSVTYDQAGRVASLVYSKPGHDNSEMLTATYTGQTVTVVKTIGEMERIFTYTLNAQGYAASCSDGRTYSYTDGYLTKLSVEGYGDFVFTYNSNHDVTAFSYPGGKDIVTPSNTPIKGWSYWSLYYFDGYQDMVLILSGMMGKSMTHAPGAVLTGGYEINRLTYTYTLDQDGYITTTRSQEDGKGFETSTITFTYEEIP